MTTEDIKSLGWKLIPWLLDSLIAVCLYVQWGVITDLNALREDHEVAMREIALIKEWKAETAGNRWTAQQQTEYAALQNKEAAQVWAKIGDIQQVWLRDVSEIKVAIARVEAQLAK